MLFDEFMSCWLIKCRMRCFRSDKIWDDEMVDVMVKLLVCWLENLHPSSSIIIYLHLIYHQSHLISQSHHLIISPVLLFRVEIWSCEHKLNREMRFRWEWDENLRKILISSTISLPSSHDLPSSHYLTFTLFDAITKDEYFIFPIFI